MKHQFNDLKQQEAINSGIGPALIMSGPGSGKTYIITHRVKKLIEDFKIPPSRILVITFTKTAALSMGQRFTELMQRDLHVTFATFHSVYYYFLKQFSLKNIPLIIDSVEANNIISRLIRSGDFKSWTDSTSEDMLYLISKYKNNRENPGKLNLNMAENADFIRLYNEYSEILKDRNLIDYDDIMIRLYDILVNDEGKRKIIKESFDAVLIDEFQDINPISYEILKLITPLNNNIFAVGDDDQSIYGFRGSSPKIMKDFIDDFKNVNVIELSNNYRSYKAIIDNALTVISDNDDRLKSGRQEAVNGDNKDSFAVMACINKNVERDFLYAEIDNALKNNERVGILTRTNKDRFYWLNLINEHYLNKNVSLNATGFYKDLYAYVSFALNSDRESLLKILNKPDRFLTRSLFYEETVDFNKLQKNLTGTGKGDSLSKLSKQFSILRKSAPYAFVKFLFEMVGYRAYYESLLSKNETEDFKNQYQMLLKDCIGMRSLNDFYIYLKDKLPKSSDKEAGPENVYVYTFHSSKGLEFDRVIITDTNEGKIPGRISLEKDSVSEERRLFYVAMTRAVKRLVIMYVQKEGSTKMLPSRFIEKLIYSSSSPNSSSSKYSSYLSNTASSSSSSSI